MLFRPFDNWNANCGDDNNDNDSDSGAKRHGFLMLFSRRHLQVLDRILLLFRRKRFEQEGLRLRANLLQKGGCHSHSQSHADQNAHRAERDADSRRFVWR